MKAIAVLLVVAAGGCGGKVEVSASNLGAGAADASAGSGGTAGAAGAGGAQGGGAGAGGESACAALAAISCDDAETCIGTELFKAYYSDRAGCESLLTRWCLAEYFQPGATVTIEDMQACIAASSQAASCSNVPVAACEPRPGTRDNGAPCGADSQCKSGFCCATYFACGTCCAPPQGGDFCWSGKCGKGFGCLYMNTCAPEVQEGDPCGVDTACPLPLVCAAGICKPPGSAQEGEPCTTAYDCASGLLTCNNSTSKCAYKSHYSAPEGAPCSFAESCQHGLTCHVAAQSPVCVAGGKLGEPCTVSDDYSSHNTCGNILACAEGKCVEMIPATCP